MVAAPDREEIANENNAATTKALVAFFIKSGPYIITRRDWCSQQPECCDVRLPPLSPLRPLCPLSLLHAPSAQRVNFLARSYRSAHHYRHVNPDNKSNK